MFVQFRLARKIPSPIPHIQLAGSLLAAVAVYGSGVPLQAWSLVWYMLVAVKLYHDQANRLRSWPVKDRTVETDGLLTKDPCMQASISSMRYRGTIGRRVPPVPCYCAAACVGASILLLAYAAMWQVLQRT